ncbi:MAG: flagellar biosynthesis protein FlhB [Thermotogae bacterium]|nr:flagellar biosynthesis protein FlhB [Thermotogota bacterium]
MDLQLFADPDKTEPATPRRRRRAREEGNVPQSRELSSSITFLIVSSVLFALLPMLTDGLKAMVNEFWSLSGPILHDFPDMWTYLGNMRNVIFTAFSLLFVATVSSIIVGLLQTRFLFAPKALKFDLNRVNPVEGMKRIFSMRSVMELLKSIFKVVIVGYVGFSVLKKAWDMLQLMPQMDTLESMQVIKSLGLELAIKMGILLVVLGAIDYFYQRWEYERNIKMTKREVKEEYKDIEGHPEVKRKQREKMVQLMRQRMMYEVPKADVVITNPVHFAVALKYDTQTMGAPRVVAKGKDLIAQRIKQIAEENGIPIVRNPSLARMLYYSVELGDEIPERFYRVVAEVLAHVYTMR